MAASIPDSPRRGSGDFARVVAPFLADAGLPFAEVLSAERIERTFRRHGCQFGQHGVYTTAIMVWSFLSQVLRDGKEASCQAAVARVVSHCRQQGDEAPTQDTGDYCRARAKLSVAALRDLSRETANELEQAAEPAWLWKGQHHAKLVDGFTFTMPDTPRNQAAYPQQKTQQPGIGWPIARAAAVISLATACVMDLAIAPYQGKETGESALLRSMLGSLGPGDVAVMDRYYCSFMMIALLLGQGAQTCARKHHLRDSDFRRGRRLGQDDHLIVWTRPQRPSWMEAADYARIPETLLLRELRFRVVAPGRRTKTIEIITTLVDADAYPLEDVAELYGFRWNAELDLRCIKANLNLGHVRCKSPEMVRRELWTTILGYNLIRATAAGAALLHHKQPRQLSFTSVCQYVLASWMQLSNDLTDAAQWPAYLSLMLRQMAACEVANRPGRLEPRVLKRRRHGYKLMMKPRNELRRELRKQCN
jgi:hypothetical protein